MIELFLNDEMEKNSMKNGNWKKLCLRLSLRLGAFLPALALLGQAQIAHAEIQTGYFEGHFVSANGDKQDAKLWIRHVVQKNGMPGTYAMLLHHEDGRSGQLFRIDELADGTQMWMQLFQSSGGMLQFGSDATYSGTSFVDGKIPHLMLAVTEFGEKIGCTERVEVHSASGPSWIEIPNVGHKIEGSHDAKGLIDSHKFTGRFLIDGKAINGTYELAPIFPGAMLMHRVTVSRDAVDGHEVKQEVTALVAVIYHKRCILSNYDEYEFVSLPAGSEMCLTPVEKLED